MKTFADAKFEIMKFPNPAGIVGKIELDNGNFEISITMNECSYGGPDGFWEIAVFEKKGSLTLPQTVSLDCLNHDVVGHLTFTELEQKIQEVQEELMSKDSDFFNEDTCILIKF